MSALPVQLPAVLTHDLAAEVMAQSQKIFSAQPTKAWVLDASALNRFDSSALAVLLGLRRLALAAGAELQVHSAPQRLGQLAGLYGVADLLHLKAH